MVFFYPQQTTTTCTDSSAWITYCSTNNTTSSSYCTTATTSSNVIYQAWVQQTQMQIQAAELYQMQRLDQLQQRYQPAAPAIIHADEERQRQELRRYQEQHNHRNAERDAANKRAEELMLAHLTPAQREQIKTHGWFIVQGGKSKLNYTIHPHAYAGNIEVEYGGRRSRLCCHVHHTIPVFDNALAQKLMLEHDEDAFLRIANRTAA